MASEAITRNDLTAILDSLFPSFYSDKTYSANGTLRVVRTFNAVQVIYSGTALNYTRNAYTLIYTLGENERPAGTVYFTAFNNNTNDVTQVPLVGYIDTLGRIYLWVYGGISGNVAPRFSVTFLKEGSR